MMKFESKEIELTKIAQMDNPLMALLKTELTCEEKQDILNRMSQHLGLNN